MIRYADPEVCPCCRLSLPYAATQCPHCHATLTGPVAQGLYRSLAHADTLVARLAAPAPAPAAVPGAAVPVTVGAPTGPRVDAAYPSFPAPRAPERRGLGAASVPRILLGLGATCLLVAAVVFLVVAWSGLGMGSRTAILLTLTVGAAAATRWMARRRLPAGVESFAVVFLGFLTLDVLGADSAGWFGALTGEGLLVLLGSVLGVAGTGTAALVARPGLRPVVGAQLAVGLGALLATLGAAALTNYTNAGVLVALVLASAALAVGEHQLRLTVAAVSAAVVGGCWWLVLVALGLARLGERPTVAGVWSHLDGWPLLAAAALAASPALLRGLPVAVRVAGAATGLTLATVVAAAPAADEPVLTLVLTGLAVVVGGFALSLVTRGAWRWLPVAPTVAAGFGLAGHATYLGSRALETFLDHGLWEIDATMHLASPSLAGHWAELLPAMVAAVMLAAAVLLRPAVDLPAGPADAVAGTAVALAVAVVPGLYDVPVGAALAVQVAVLGALALAATALGRSLPAAALGAGAVLLAPVVLATALAVDWLTAATLLAGTVAAAAAAYAGRGVVRIAGDALLVPCAGGFAWTALHLADGDVSWRAVPVLLLAGALAVHRPVVQREVPAALVGAVAMTASVVTSTGVDQTWLAAYLTLAGALVTVSALLHPHRRALGWAGLTLLTLAQWVRLEQLGVDEVEAYTLPLALVLVAVGLWRMAHAGLSSRAALSPGLGLALGPSLLLALVDPVSTRAALLGLACLVLVLAGVGTRWAAPLVAGASVGAVLVLREAQYAEVLPQWVLIGLVGTVLTVVGVTWEQRLADLRTATGYVRRLR